ncbi:MAG: SAM-dependent methyltransferase [Actinobacteria bacterium]|jgi:O-methyltransferase involved in polyketide biosynthesis|nr:SAM-dependent methyltransferase [Actinomycetota bacterium]
MKPVATTALLAAAARARESAGDYPLFRDPYARRLAGVEGIRLLERLNADVPEAAGLIGVVIRTYFMDRQLEGLLAGRSVSQVVLLGAGMDTRAYRINYAGTPEGATNQIMARNQGGEVRFFEVDDPELLRLKERRLHGASTLPHIQRIPVGGDLESTDLANLLIGHGFDPDRPTAWIVEGLFIYLQESSVHRLVSGITHLSASGSYLLCDIVSRNLLAHGMTSRLRRHFATGGFSMQFGTDDPAALLGKYGWQADVHTMSEIGASTGKLPVVASLGVTPAHGDGYLVSATYGLKAHLGGAYS